VIGLEFGVLGLLLCAAPSRGAESPAIPEAAAAYLDSKFLSAEYFRVNPDTAAPRDAHLRFQPASVTFLPPKSGLKDARFLVVRGGLTVAGGGELAQGVNDLAAAFAVGDGGRRVAPLLFDFRVENDDGCGGDTLDRVSVAAYPPLPTGESLARIDERFKDVPCATDVTSAEWTVTHLVAFQNGDRRVVLRLETDRREETSSYFPNSDAGYLSARRRVTTTLQPGPASLLRLRTVAKTTHFSPKGKAKSESRTTDQELRWDASTRTFTSPARSR
jgi:hypothetical protein